MGDPTIAGWTATFLYVAASWLSARKWLKNARARTHERRAWCILTTFMVLLGLNKQLDLQTSLINLGRSLYYSLALYEYKRPIELVAFALTVLLLGGAGLLCAQSFRRTKGNTRVALFGLCVILSYVLLRAARFERLTGEQRGDDSWHSIIEFLGLLTVVWSARPPNYSGQASAPVAKTKVFSEK